MAGLAISGRSSLSINQGFEFIDTDVSIENKNSMTINEIFEQKGEKGSDDWFLQVGHLTFFLFNFKFEYYFYRNAQIVQSIFLKKLK